MSYTTAGAPSSPLFDACFQQHLGATDAVLLCVTSGLEQQAAAKRATITSWLLVLCGALVFLMQLGFAMLCAGCVRRKNVSNTLLKNLLDACGAAVAWFVVGYAFSFGGQSAEDGVTFVGVQGFFLTGDVDMAFWFFQLTFSAAAVTIIAGTLAERCRMSAYISYSIFMTGFIYPVVVHSIWSENGFLSAFSAEPFMGSGVVDFAGSGVVHLTGGSTALVATYILGARKGRFTNSAGESLDEPKEIPGHSIALQTMGTLLLWFGWYGFNGGSALVLPDAEDQGAVAALAAVNTTLAAAFGSISAMATYMSFTSKKNGLSFDLSKALNGSLAGLVAITSGCGTVEPWASALIGVVAGWVYLGGSTLLVKCRLDDAVDGIPIHMFCGIWGLLATGLFTSPGRLLDAFGNDDHVGLFYSVGRLYIDGALLLNQFLAVLFILGWTIGMMTPFFLLLNYMKWLRADAMEEIAGLDASYKVAIQEDHEDLKKKIVAEYRKHQEDSRTIRGERQSSSTWSSTPEFEGADDIRMPQREQM